MKRSRSLCLSLAFCFHLQPLCLSARPRDRVQVLRCALQDPTQSKLFSLSLASQCEGEAAQKKLLCKRKQKTNSLAQTASWTYKSG